ncbi:primase-helicase family protein [uncultured Draconibacterium sp.]|uniref:primase-helicase family protein n=1 Tax=uncultured Draconibacterium sp. TaxID=1573823 RepID=UPI002632298F|nr:primase-helicase family protein [uncultured Draconibacterium sp.]
MSDMPYIRVGTSYFKKVKAPTISGDFNEILVPWNIDTIKQDFGKTYVADIPKYDGFTCIPNHINFKQVCLGFYNKYSPLSNKPKKGPIDVSTLFVKHIFGNQYELGLDYLQLLYQKPVHILPILCLVSKERSTGKSTFLKWLKAIFENNLTYLTNDSFGSQFNSDWANKLLICIDEVLFNKEELTERIKYLSTTNHNKMEAKGKDKIEVEFFGKFILCSNNEDNFIKIDAAEERFWVRKISKFETEDTDLLDKLVKEIPAFLFFLNNRELSSPRITRMWFTPAQIRTRALQNLIRHNRSRVEKELASILFMVMEKYDLDEVEFCPQDAMFAVNQTRVKTDLTQIRHLLKKEWKLTPKSNSLTYEKFAIWNRGEITRETDTGRFYTVKKGFLLENFDELMNE